MAVIAGVTTVFGLVLTLSPGSDVEAQRISSQLDLDSGELRPALSALAVEAMAAEEQEQATPLFTVEEQQRAARIAAAAPSRANIADQQLVTDNQQQKPPVEEVTAPPEPQLTEKTFEVKAGDTLSRLFSRAGLNDSAMYQVLRGEGLSDQLGRLRQGQQIDFVLNEEGQLQQLTLHQNRTKKLQANLGEEGFKTTEVSREPDIILAFAGGEIESSFALSARRAGLNNRLSSNLASIFGWQIDFGRDLRRGDRFSVLYEELHVDGEKVGYGRILSANFHNRGKNLTAILFTNSEGHSEYFAPDGTSLRKAFIRTPLEYSRISSRFDPQRRHPILNRVRPHQGTDFAAPTGTPVRAAGDGRVRHARRDGGYGRTIRIQHGNGVETVYAHLNGYASGIQEGGRVRQGQVIGYVGMSGMATGPHLHYEYRQHGQPRDPMRVALPDADPVPKEQMTAFQTQSQPLMAQLATRDESFQVAMAEE
ncbi:MAG: peptidase M23 [Halomonadaceae bacterium]|nr:MAG: peptidase M23 [Halomonadaceae bacterium]